MRKRYSRTYLQVAFLLIILRKIWRRIGYVSRCLKNFPVEILTILNAGNTSRVIAKSWELFIKSLMYRIIYRIVDDVLSYAVMLIECQKVERKFSTRYCELSVKKKTNGSKCLRDSWYEDRSRISSHGCRIKARVRLDGESQEWGLACRWHGDVTQLSTPQKVGSSIWTR